MRHLASGFLGACTLALIFILFAGPVHAAPAMQTVDEQQPVAASEPLEITIRQLVPVLLDLSVNATDTLTVTGPLILDFDFLIQLGVTETLTSTVPATITLQITELSGAPVSFEMGVYPLASVQVVRAAPITVTSELTETSSVTATEPVSPTEVVETEAVTETVEAEPTAPAPEETPAPDGPVGVAATAIVTANLRGGPGVEFPLVGSAGAGQQLDVVAVSADGEWFLLSDATWVAEFLVENPPPDLPLATPEFIESLTAPPAEEATPTPTASPEPTEETPAATPTPSPEPEPEATAEPTVEPTAEPTATPTEVPTPAPAQPVATVDANLRSGPGTQFAIVGGTVTGQVLNIVGQSADGAWFLLDNGGWIASFLVANPPADVLVIPISAPAPEAPAPALGLPTPTTVPPG